MKERQGDDKHPLHYQFQVQINNFFFNCDEIKS